LIPADYPRIRLVASFDELVATPFGDGVNALCWPRVLPGNFGEIVERLGCGEGISTVNDARLLALELSAAGMLARNVLIADQQRLRDRDLAPLLNCIDGCPRDTDDAPMARDVLSFHVDSATVETDTYLCTYHGAPSEGLRNDQAQRHVDVPATRAKLLTLYGGKDDEGFLKFLNDNYYDLHYASLPQARPFSFGLGNLWRIATVYPGCPVPPCIHRAPATVPGQPRRLLLIS
jgi:hypothetical protein